MGDVGAPVKSGSSSSEGFHEDNIKLMVKQSSELDDVVFIEPESTITNTPSIIVSEINGNNNSQTQQQIINLNLNTFEHKRLEILFSRCESLYAHGYKDQSCILAKLLAEYLLSTYNVDKFFDDLIKCKNFICSSNSNSVADSSAVNKTNKFRLITSTRPPGLT
jgi:hypothetical protein